MDTNQQNIPPPGAVGYAFPQGNADSSQSFQPYQTAPPSHPSNVYVQPAPPMQPHFVHTAAEKSKPDALVWGFSGSMLVVIFVVFLLGILVVKVPWLGIFAIVSIIPSMVIMWVLYWRQHRDKAYLPRVTKFVIIGMLGVAPVALIELILDAIFKIMDKAMDGHVPTLFEIFFLSFTNAFLVAALCEEFFKYIMAARVTTLPHRDSPYSVAIYSTAGAIGLATLENMMYVLIAGANGDLFITVFTAITRAFMAVPLHATTGLLIGCDVGMNRFNIKQRNFFQIFLVPFLLHGTYDFCTMFTSFYYAAYDKVPASIVWLPVISAVLVVVGVVYARSKRRELLALETAALHPLLAPPQGVALV
mmetsp:Transcript_26354/g.37103  ORF Transcript_26354/g.37103 Transcript_26354/m.37103 type:complete len:361 (-) Transcript_26354:57-1139(-)